MIDLTSKRVGKTLKTIDVKMKLIPRVPLSMVRCNAPVCRLLNNSSMISIHQIMHNQDPKDDVFTVYLKWNVRSRLCKCKNTCNHILSQNMYLFEPESVTLTYILLSHFPTDPFYDKKEPTFSIFRHFIT
jgi:hypothetical protein